jgi:transposase
MPKYYSQDFRQKVVDAIELDGHKKCEVSDFFNISRNTMGASQSCKSSQKSSFPLR